MRVIEQSANSMLDACKISSYWIEDSNFAMCYGHTTLDACIPWLIVIVIEWRSLCEEHIRWVHAIDDAVCH